MVHVVYSCQRTFRGGPFANYDHQNCKEEKAGQEEFYSFEPGKSSIEVYLGDQVFHFYLHNVARLGIVSGLMKKMG